MTVVISAYTQDPNEKLDYSIDWTSWLAPGDTIASSEWAVLPAGPTLSQKTVDIDGKVATCFVEGVEVGIKYTLSNTIVTAPGTRIAERSVSIKGADK